VGLVQTMNTGAFPGTIRHPSGETALKDSGLPPEKQPTRAPCV
jgi:hypothetical protein